MNLNALGIVAVDKTRLSAAVTSDLAVANLALKYCFLNIKPEAR